MSGTTIKMVSTCSLVLPLFGLVFAIFWSLVMDFEASTKTHCHVTNIFPSVSAAVSLKPQSYVWRICISLHISPRFVLAYCYWIWFSHHFYDETKMLHSYIKSLKVASFCSNVVEVLALLGLTLISSVENFAAHQACFVLFVVGSLICMLSMCLLNSMMCYNDEEEKRSKKLKKNVYIVNIISLAMAMYFYYRHNEYCEPGVYSLFALSEYIFILSNMAFHYTARLDFSKYSVILQGPHESKFNYMNTP